MARSKTQKVVGKPQKPVAPSKPVVKPPAAPKLIGKAHAAPPAAKKSAPKPAPNYFTKKHIGEPTSGPSPSPAPKPKAAPKPIGKAHAAPKPAPTKVVVARVELEPPPRRPSAIREDMEAIELDAELAGAGALTAEDHRFIARVMRFLVTVQSPSLLRIARREGYAARDHKEGWKLLRDAAGESRPLDHLLADHDVGTPKERESHLALLQQIDSFENTWFPRTRAIIRRVVPGAERDAFSAAFFDGLQQQPLGPLVVGSVGTYLGRVDELAASKHAASKKVLATLRARGLSPKRIEAMRALLAEAIAGEGKKPPKQSVKEVVAGQKVQTDALSGLHDWFNDWGTTLRSVFGAADQIRLGLTAVRSPTVAAPAEPSTPLASA